MRLTTHDAFPLIIYHEPHKYVIRQREEQQEAPGRSFPRGTKRGRPRGGWGAAKQITWVLWGQADSVITIVIFRGTGQDTRLNTC